MRHRAAARWFAALSSLAVLAALMTGAASAQSPTGDSDRYLVVAKDAADYGGLRAMAVRHGARVVNDIQKVNTMVVTAAPAARDTIAADGRAAAVARDHVVSFSPPEQRGRPTAAGRSSRQDAKVTRESLVRAQRTRRGIDPDPGLDYKGLQWDFGRVGLPKGWDRTAGSPEVSVGVAATGLAFTHAELRNKVVKVINFHDTACFDVTGVSDADLAAELGGPEDGDWNGHGSWIGGNIAAELDGQGINGIAPKVGLVALKISDWCGSAYDSTLIEAFTRAADEGVDVVSISFGGYLDRTDPEQEPIYQQYLAAVEYARSKGTIIAASAGNEHVELGANGQVVSTGQLTLPGDPLDDLHGLWELPGGVPQVVNVSATGNVVNASSESCPPGTAGDAANTSATCKPASDPHQSPGTGKQDQLAYYSNYGSGIDLAAPGGARKFNLPVWDRGGTPGFPYTGDDLTNVWEDFSITSNWATGIPCYVFTSPDGQCYSSIQGTSMATPHV